MAVSRISVDVERQPGSQVRLRVETPPEEVDAAIDQSLRRLASRVRVAGFRPGKAPPAMVERLVGWETIRRDTIEHLVPDVYQRALDQSGVEPVSEPQLDVEALERDKPLTFTATVTVKPEVNLGDYSSLRVAPQTTEVTDEQVDEAVERIRRRHSELVEVQRPAQAGDVLRATLLMRRGDDILSGEGASERDVELDRQTLMPEIVDGVIGLSAGEHRSFDVTLPPDYRREELRGATVTIDIDVHAVRERKLPPLDDSLAVLDGHGRTLSELRDVQREALVNAAEVSDREQHEQRALEAFRDVVRVDVPEAMIDREVERQLADMEYRLSAMGIPFGKYLELSGQTIERLRGERREAAAQRVKLELALDALASAEGIEVDETQVQREVQRISEGRRLDASQRRRLHDLARRDLLRQAAAQRLLEIVGGDEFVPT